METTLKIRIDNLRRIANLLFDRAEELGYTEVDVNHSYYWDILNEEVLYNPGKTPTEEDMGLGDLFEDWEFLNAQLTVQDPVSGLNMLKLAAILRAVGPQILG